MQQPDPTQIPMSSTGPVAIEPCADGALGGPDGIEPPVGERAADFTPILFTPAQAAALLQVRESWLRRRAARRTVPCTFLGKHLRFSAENLQQIASDAAGPAPEGRCGSAGKGSRRRGIETNSRKKASTPSGRQEHI